MYAIIPFKMNFLKTIKPKTLSEVDINSINLRTNFILFNYMMITMIITKMFSVATLTRITS